MTPIERAAMSEDEFDAVRKEMLAGFFKAMLLASETEVDGERAAFISSEIALDAIIHLQAAIIESAPRSRRGRTFARQHRPSKSVCGWASKT